MQKCLWTCSSFSPEGSIYPRYMICFLHPSRLYSNVTLIARPPLSRHLKSQSSQYLCSCFVFPWRSHHDLRYVFSFHISLVDWLLAQHQKLHSVRFPFVLCSCYGHQWPPCCQIYGNFSFFVLTFQQYLICLINLINFFVLETIFNSISWYIL